MYFVGFHPPWNQFDLGPRKYILSPRCSSYGLREFTRHADYDHFHISICSTRHCRANWKQCDAQVGTPSSLSSRCRWPCIFSFKCCLCEGEGTGLLADRWLRRRSEVHLMGTALLTNQLQQKPLGSTFLFRPVHLALLCIEIFCGNRYTHICKHPFCHLNEPGFLQSDQRPLHGNWTDV